MPQQLLHSIRAIDEIHSAPFYFHDGQSHLMSASHNGNVVFLTYDGLGRCVRRVAYAPNGSSKTVLFTYDGWKPTMEWDGAGNLAAWNIYGAGADEILWRYTVAHEENRNDQRGLESL